VVIRELVASVVAAWVVEEVVVFIIDEQVALTITSFNLFNSGYLP